MDFDDLPPDEQDKIINDVILYGQGCWKDGKRVPPPAMYNHPMYNSVTTNEEDL